MSEVKTSLIPQVLIPPGVRDERQFALAQLFGEKLSAVDLKTLTMADPMIVDARLLPFMIREFGAQDFIDPELPTDIQRRILKNIWKLKSLHGFDAGVKLGLELLGMTAEIIHWHQRVPKGPANTHTVRFGPLQRLYPDEAGYFGAKSLKAAARMIDATKRFSQATTVEVFLPANATRFVGITSTHRMAVSNVAGIPPAPIANAIAKVGIATFGQLTAPSAQCERIAA